MGAIIARFDDKASAAIARRLKLNRNGSTGVVESFEWVYNSPIPAELAKQREKSIQLVKEQRFVEAVELVVQDAQAMASDLNRVVLLFEVMSHVDKLCDEKKLSCHEHEPSFRRLIRKYRLPSAVLANAFSVLAAHRFFSTWPYLLTVAYLNAKTLNADFLLAGGMDPLLTLNCVLHTQQCDKLGNFRFAALRLLADVMCYPGSRAAFLSAKPTVDLSHRGVLVDKSLQRAVLEVYFDASFNGQLESGLAMFLHFSTSDNKLGKKLAKLFLTLFDGKLIAKAIAILEASTEPRWYPQKFAVALFRFLSNTVEDPHVQLLSIVKPLARFLSRPSIPVDILSRALPELGFFVSEALTANAGGNPAEAPLLRLLAAQPNNESCSAILKLPLRPLPATATSQQRKAFEEARVMASKRCGTKTGDGAHIHMLEMLAVLSSHDSVDVRGPARSLLMVVRACGQLTPGQLQELSLVSSALSVAFLGRPPRDHLAGDLFGPVAENEDMQQLRRADTEPAAKPSLLRECSGCGKSETEPNVKLMMCSRCRIARYCSHQCLKSSWPTHRHVCRPVAKPQTKVKSDSKGTKDSNALSAASTVTTGSSDESESVPAPTTVAAKVSRS